MPKFNVGDVVECIDMGTTLTIGKLYTVIDEATYLVKHPILSQVTPPDYFKGWTCIIDDENEPNAYKDSRFVLYIKPLDYFAITKDIVGG